MSLGRRALLAAGGASLALPQRAGAQGAAKVLRMVPQANLTSLDPVFTSANITRNHGYMVYDQLYGFDEHLSPQPQMASGHVVEDDGRRVTITLREGLVFHDGEPVRGRDAAASLGRWMKRNSFGQKLATVVDEIAAPADDRLVLRLSRPFPLLFHALAGTSQSAFILPERLARTDPFKQITDPTGSGPFRMKRDEFNSGSLVVYERHQAYRPREEAPSLTAGGKRVFFDRVEWRIITDQATAAAALQQGEIDWFEQPPPELQQMLKANRQIRIEPIDRLPSVAVLRPNHLFAPFNDVAVRRALLPAIDQADYMQAIVGDDPAMYVTGVGFFTPGTPNANTVGLDALTGPRSIERAKAMLKEAGYAGQPMRLIGPTDILAPAAITQVAADMFRRLGMNMELVLTDWGSVIQRRASREPLDKGGWSVFLTSFSSFDFVDPSGHPLLRGNGLQAWPGWPTIPELERVRDMWFDAADEAQRRALCGELQRIALDQVSAIPVGGYFQPTALSSRLVGRVPGFAIFWGIRPG